MKKSMKKRLGNAIANAQRVRQECLDRGRTLIVKTEGSGTYADAVATAVSERNNIVADLDTALCLLIEEVHQTLVEN